MRLFVEGEAGLDPPGGGLEHDGSVGGPPVLPVDRVAHERPRGKLHGGCGCYRVGRTTGGTTAAAVAATVATPCSFFVATDSGRHRRARRRGAQGSAAAMRRRIAVSRPGLFTAALRNDCGSCAVPQRESGRDQLWGLLVSGEALFSDGDGVGPWISVGFPTLREGRYRGVPIVRSVGPPLQRARDVGSSRRSNVFGLGFGRPARFGSKGIGWVRLPC